MKRRRSFGTRVDDRLTITPSSVPLSSSIAIAELPLGRDALPDDEDRRVGVTDDRGRFASP